MLRRPGTEAEQGWGRLLLRRADQVCHEEELTSAVNFISYCALFYLLCCREPSSFSRSSPVFMEEIVLVPFSASESSFIICLYLLHVAFVMTFASFELFDSLRVLTV